MPENEHEVEVPETDANAQVTEQSANPDEQKETKQSQEKFRPLFFKEQQSHKETQKKLEGTEALLERATQALEMLSKSRVEEKPAPKVEKPEEDPDAAFMRLLAGEDPAPKEPEKKPVVEPEKGYLTQDDFNERMSKIREDLRRENAVSDTVRSMMPALQQLFTDKDGKVDESQVRQAAEVIAEKAIKSDLPPQNVAIALFHDRIIQKERMAAEAAARESVKKEMLAKLAEANVDLVAAGLDSAPVDPLDEVLQAEADYILSLNPGDLPG